jgi:hypothetical protein
VGVPGWDETQWNEGERPSSRGQELNDLADTIVFSIKMIGSGIVLTFSDGNFDKRIFFSRE